jgi:hypothetical protein
MYSSQQTWLLSLMVGDHLRKLVASRMELNGFFSCYRIRLLYIPNGVFSWVYSLKKEHEYEAQEYGSSHPITI